MTRLTTVPSAREQVRHALTLLGVPAAAWLIVAAHGVFLSGDLSTGLVARLGREDQRRWDAEHQGWNAEHQIWDAERLANGEPGNDGERRPDGGQAVPSFYLCPALAAAGLTPARGVLALSTWPLANRILTARGAQADKLAATARLAECAAQLTGVGPALDRLLRRLAGDVPGGEEAYDAMRPHRLADAARAALARDGGAIRAERAAAAARAEKLLDERQQLFGAPHPTAPA